MLDPAADDDRVWELTIQIALLPSVREAQSTVAGLSEDEKAVRELTLRELGPSQIFLPALTKERVSELQVRS